MFRDWRQHGEAELQLQVRDERAVDGQWAEVKSGCQKQCDQERLFFRESCTSKQKTIWFVLYSVCVFPRKDTCI